MTEEVQEQEIRERGPEPAEEAGMVKSPVLRHLLMGLGFLSVGLAVVGIVLPLLPTTPFLLLAAWCFSRSSRKFHHWLLSNRWFGQYIKDYQSGKGIPTRAKISALTLLWASILFTIIFFVDRLVLKLLLLGIASVVSYHILTVGRTGNEG